MMKRIEIRAVAGGWFYAVYVGARVIVVGLAQTLERAVRSAEMA
jgi:hypothetical protein